MAGVDNRLSGLSGSPTPSWAGAPQAVDPWSSPSGSLVEAEGNGGDELPPSYEAARIPTEPIEYTFSAQSFNTMLLIPPLDAPDTRPLYHVSVAMNCFIPSSYITTIRRGATEFGDYVAEFEMGDSEDSETVTIHGKQRLLSDVMARLGTKIQGTHTWRGRLRPSYTSGKLVTLTWKAQANTKQCLYEIVGQTGVKPKHVATWLAPPKVPPQTGIPKPATTVTIMPAAYDYAGLLDQIILSGLILERQRLAKK